jgi:hypothetical protein
MEADACVPISLRIARLMRDNDLKARQRSRFKKTTDSDHGWPVAPNHLDQDFAERSGAFRSGRSPCASQGRGFCITLIVAASIAHMITSGCSASTASSLR